ncbi:MFS transporter [Pelomonas sp. CA6]|uniref:MFS transporter n=1 Tax=Pelomonas sp. CA6 TaxID=2907999 RepID=UPI001F4BEB53|nr:MFS transporter [Pelomonas sp. CA6]MCH7343358.1 MFS transporter [Pelomonas sp. CA6]
MDTSLPGHQPQAQPPHARRTGWATTLIAAYGMLALIVASLFTTLDGPIILLMEESIRQSLRMTDTQLGLLQGAGFTLVAGIASVPIAWLADRYGRRGLLALSVLVWAGATVGCGLAPDFPSLFLATAGVGIGAAGLGPVVFGLIPQIVSARHRVLANGAFMLTTMLGGSLALILSGALAESLEALRPLLPAVWQGLEPWRVALLVLTLPSPLVALALLLIRLHPARADAEAPAEPARATPSAFRPYWQQHGRTLTLVFAGVGLASVGLVASASWLPVIAGRHFGSSMADVGQGIGLANLLGVVLGAVAGAVGVKLLGGRLGVALPMRVIAVGSLVATVATAAMPMAPSADVLYVLFGVQGASLVAGTVLVPTLLQDMTPEALQSRVIALGSVVTVVIASGTPVLVGALSDLIQASPAGLLAISAGLGAAGLALGAWLMFVAERPYIRTVHAVHPDMAKAPLTL